MPKTTADTCNKLLKLPCSRQLSLCSDSTTSVLVRICCAIAHLERGLG
ncbi:hypothetical protein [Chlorogloeopsis fritschii]|nr:hypothetical protein [Chlorogloeopsis fritschii]